MQANDNLILSCESQQLLNFRKEVTCSNLTPTKTGESACSSACPVACWSSPFGHTSSASLSCMQSVDDSQNEPPQRVKGAASDYRSVHGASKGYPSGAKEPLSRDQTLWDVTVHHAYASQTNTSSGEGARIEHLGKARRDWPPVLRAAGPRRTPATPRRGRFWQTFPNRRVDEARGRGATPRSSWRIRAMACGGRRRAARHEPGGLDLGFARAGNAILHPNHHGSADVNHRDEHDRNERQSDPHRETWRGCSACRPAMRRRTQ